MRNREIDTLRHCRMCQHKRLVWLFSLGNTPPANAFLRKSELTKKEKSFPLRLVFCPNCFLVQLGHVVSPKLLFRNYVYASSTSPIFRRHFEDYATAVVTKTKLKPGSLVIDIGSNDGILLKPFAKLGMKVLGIDPAVAIARQATREGLPTVAEFFTPKLANQLVKKYGEAQVVTANNVFAHVHDLDELVIGVKRLLAKDGMLVIEFPYVVDLLEKNLFDTIYHEHLSYLSVRPLIAFFALHQMEIIHAQHVDSHGGSLRVWVGFTNNHQVERSVASYVSKEKRRKLNTPLPYLKLGKRVGWVKHKLLKLLQQLEKQGHTVVGYGAPAKGNTLLNYFGLGPELIKFIVDDSPYKQGLYTPGTHIPVVDSKRLIEEIPDYVVILAWNFASSIVDKYTDLALQGTKFIVPLPKPRVVEPPLSLSGEDLLAIVAEIKLWAGELQGKTVLISGGSGFIGSYIVAVLHLLNKRVLKRPCKVISVDNYITSDKENLLLPIHDPAIQFVKADISKPLKIRGKVDYIIHAAGLASPHYYKKFPLATIESAFLGAKNLLELARKKQVKSWLFFSSSEIYGDPDPKFVPTPETYAGNVSSIGPRACYDESKRFTETLAITYFQACGVPAKIIRLFNVYGPGMRANDFRVVPNFIYHGLKSEALGVNDRGTQTRTFCYISDAVVGIFKVLLKGKPGEAYNVGNDKPEISMRDLAALVVELVGTGAKPKLRKYPADYPAGEPQRRCPDITKIKRELGYKPQVSLRVGLKRTIEWFGQAYPEEF